MGMLSLIFGLIGGLCVVFGVITMAELLPPLGEEFTWVFWFALSVILLLASIAFGVNRGSGEID
jgi:hypothetical protein